MQVQGGYSSAHLAACALAAIATGRALDTLGFALFGMYGAWLYVRYLQPRPDGSASATRRSRLLRVVFSLRRRRRWLRLPTPRTRAVAEDANVASRTRTAQGLYTRG